MRFEEYAPLYLAKETVRQKRADTLYNERLAINRWREHLGAMPLDQITGPVVRRHIDRRLAGGQFCGRELAAITPRTANLELIALRNVLNAAVGDGCLSQLPILKPLRERPPARRPLLTNGQFDRLLTSVGTACRKNAMQFERYLRFLAFSGAREQEALRVRIDDVDFERRCVTIGADGLSKNGDARAVDFNQQLESLLTDIVGQRPLDTSWLFPSPQRGARDIHARSFRESLKIARAAADLPWFGFHDLRHYFASTCVMAGIDFMTIAEWLGHKDRGILVAKIYGHLSSEHRRNMARRLVFGARLAAASVAIKPSGVDEADECAERGNNSDRSHS